MKVYLPQISWHDRGPIYSVDIQLNGYTDQPFTYRIASGGSDGHVIIWKTYFNENNDFKIELQADLSRHVKPVNVVRFSPSSMGNYLASGDDEGTMYIWTLNTSNEKQQNVSNNEMDTSLVNEEDWVLKTRYNRWQLDDISDLSWSPNGLILAGSVNNKIGLYDFVKEKDVNFPSYMQSEHKSFVQGVAWDPQNRYFATLSADRTLRICCTKKKKVLFRIHKANIDFAGKTNSTKLFFDDTLKSYCRRLTFSPNGEFLLVPSGIVELSNGTNDVRFINSVYLFISDNLQKPIALYPTGDKFTIATRCCPTLFELREGLKPIIPLKYRIVFAVATQDSILFYDTQQTIPFAIASNFHLTRFSDLAWSHDGRVLIASSTDGYCSMITFEEKELGIPYHGSVYVAPEEITPVKKAKIKVPKIVTPKEKTPEPAPKMKAITSFFAKIDKEKCVTPPKSEDSIKKEKTDIIDLTLEPQSQENQTTEEDMETADSSLLIVPNHLNNVCEGNFLSDDDKLIGHVSDLNVNGHEIGEKVINLKRTHGTEDGFLKKIKTNASFPKSNFSEQANKNTVDVLTAEVKQSETCKVKNTNEHSKSSIESKTKRRVPFVTLSTPQIKKTL